MATQAAENPLKAIKNKTWILKTSIHCEGCKRKVEKILNQVLGVENVKVDIKQQKVIVTGNVEGDSLIKKLIKSGKKAELWPEKTEKKEKNSGQERNKEKQIKRQNNEHNVRENGSKKEQKPTGNVKAVQDSAKISDRGTSISGSAVKSGGGSVGTTQVDGEVKSDAGGSAKVSDLIKATGGVQVAESKLEKKPEPESSADSAPPPPQAKEEKGDSESKSGVASEKSNDGSESSDGVETHTSAARKQKGQNGNNMENAKSSAATPASTGSDKHRGAGPPPISIPANHIPPLQHNYHDHPFPLHHYGPPPVYAVSYDTTYPTSSYTTSYASPPPHSYVYTYSGREVEPPPLSYSDSYPPHPPSSELDSYPQRPLDSFEMFSDENPNGCFIM